MNFILDSSLPTFILYRIHPLHDSDSILLVRSNHYQKNLEAVKTWYTNEYDNWHTVDGEASRWLVWDMSRKYALYTAQQIQQYLFQISFGEKIVCNLANHYRIVPLCT